MNLNPVVYANIYANLAAYHTKQAILNVADKAAENKSELTCIAATTVVVGLAARVAGFKAGYAFANNA